MASTFMTVLEGRVAQDQWAALVEKVKAMPVRPAGLEQAYLVQDMRDREVWRMVGVWTSREAFDAMSQAMGTPPPMAIFQSVGAQPALSTFDIMV